MPKKGENVYKRVDGRWEGRYIKTHAADGKAKYGYVYAKHTERSNQNSCSIRIIPLPKAVSTYIAKYCVPAPGFFLPNGIVLWIPLG